MLNTCSGGRRHDMLKKFRRAVFQTAAKAASAASAGTLESRVSYVEVALYNTSY
jgi:hypothetical protein